MERNFTEELSREKTQMEYAEAKWSEQVESLKETVIQAARENAQMKFAEDKWSE